MYVNIPIPKIDLELHWWRLSTRLRNDATGDDGSPQLRFFVELRNDRPDKGASDKPAQRVGFHGA
ncbi:MAG: hypothetical protein ACRCYU_12155 [Nocardioides sp.]